MGDPTCDPYVSVLQYRCGVLSINFNHIFQVHITDTKEMCHRPTNPVQMNTPGECEGYYHSYFNIGTL